ncbi:hypothetical protein AVEN_232499-1 [Araneus ventricosus]|uniref:PSI domain-containing protein n=1 Tax=Araneus ventricosus TaxID=182803 RepID=A0A4Y2SK39_ARAVE|nr:hypothetical protein AVEN_232499-1 [Araneus ventricosus]
MMAKELAIISLRKALLVTSNAFSNHQVLYYTTIDSPLAENGISLIAAIFFSFQAVVETVLKASEYADLVIDERSPVNAEMVFDRAKNHLYVMTEKRVTMVNVQECHLFKMCRDCLGANDPYCGWCSLENKCSFRGACAEADQDPLYWLPYKSGRCTAITEVHPPQIQRTTAGIGAYETGSSALDCRGKKRENPRQTENAFRCSQRMYCKREEGPHCVMLTNDSQRYLVPGGICSAGKHFRFLSHDHSIQANTRCFPSAFTSHRNTFSES